MFVRTLGWRAWRSRSCRCWRRRRGYLESFADGVNAYLADHSRRRALPGVRRPPPRRARLHPRAVDARRLAGLAEGHGVGPGGNIQDEIDRSLESTRLTPAADRRALPAVPVCDPSADRQPGSGGQRGLRAGRHPWRQPAASATGLPARAFAPALGSVRRASSALDHLLGSGDGVGSNAWAVSGDHTASGPPILANDPHLAPSMPGIWYEMGLHCRTLRPTCPFDVSGFTFAGLPGVVIGHNREIAWGFTNLDPDTEDLYLEKVDGNRYRYNGSWLPLQTRRETFDIKGESPESITVRTTRARTDRLGRRPRPRACG